MARDPAVGTPCQAEPDPARPPRPAGLPAGPGPEPSPSQRPHDHMMTEASAGPDKRRCLRCHRGGRPEAGVRPARRVTSSVTNTSLSAALTEAAVSGWNCRSAPGRGQIRVSHCRVVTVTVTESP
jgi:hypothetical protein